MKDDKSLLSLINSYKNETKEIKDKYIDDVLKSLDVDKLIKLSYILENHIDGDMDYLIYRVRKEFEERL